LGQQPFTVAVSGLIAQQLLGHGEGLDGNQLAPRASARGGSGGVGERRCREPERDVLGLEIFFFLCLG
jgi:hypothetical protein